MGEYDDEGDLSSGWGGQRWWYKLAQVCRWWRYLILASPSRLDLHLLCTHGVPIADMLAHSPPLPLAIYHCGFGHETTEEDEEGILLALRLSDRVHYIHFDLPSRKLWNIITTMDEQFPILGRLYIWSWTEGDTEGDTGLLFPLVLLRIFQAPHLLHLVLGPAALPIGSPIIHECRGPRHSYPCRDPTIPLFPPSYLLTWLSLMPQLENLGIRFYSPLRDDDDEDEIQLLGQLDTPIIMHITLPNLRRFEFRGVSTNLEGLLN